MYKIFVSAMAYDSGRSGISVYINNVLREMGKKNELEVLAFRDDIPRLPQSDNIKYLPLSSFLRNPVINMFWHLFILPWILPWRKYDFVLLPAGNRRLLSFYRKFTIAVVHDLSQYHVEQKYDCFRMFYCKKILPFYLKAVNRTVAVSGSTAKDLAHYWKIPESRISINYNGYDKHAFNSKPVENSELLRKLDVNKKYILYVSRIEHPGKNHLNLIKAYESLPEKLQNEYDLVLAGTFWAGSEPVKNYAENSKVSANIKFPGFIGHDDLPALYHGASLYIFPSFFEGFGLSLLEAMACGIPVACSSTSSLGEIGADAALLFDPEKTDEISSAMESILENSELRTKLIQKAFEHLKAFDWSKHATELVAVYERSAKISARNPFFDFPVRIFESLIALVICLFFVFPVFVIAFLRWLFTRKDIFVNRRIYGCCERKLTIRNFNFENIVLSRLSLFFQVMIFNLRLVGVSIHSRDDARENGDMDLFMDSPGIFSLWFVRRGRGTAYEGRLKTELEYLKTRSFSGDVMIILRTLPAILFSSHKLNSPRKINLMDIEFDNITMNETIEALAADIAANRKKKVAFVNSDCFNKSTNDKNYLDLLHKSDYILPDGIGILLACKMLKVGLKENVNGTDMLPFLCEMAVRNHYSVFLFGARPGVASMVRQNLLKIYPSLQIVGERSGYFDSPDAEKEMISRINSLNPDILLVALGVPSQERWIAEHYDELPCRLMIGVGGLFDFYSGRIKRAPSWLREIGFEWLFRLAMEPVRMFKRYIIGNPLFLWRVLRWKIKINKSNE